MQVKNSDPISHRGEELTRAGYERWGTFQSSPIENISGENATIFQKTFAATKYLLSAKRLVKVYKY